MTTTCKVCGDWIDVDNKKCSCDNKTKIVNWGKDWKKPKGYRELRNEPSRQRTIFIKND